MTTIIATFADRVAMHSALAALTADGTFSNKVDIVHPVADDPRAPTAPGSSLGGVVGAVAVAAGAAIAVAASGGAILAAGPILAAVSGAAAGGMLGGAVGAVVSGENNKVPDEEAHTAPSPSKLRLRVNAEEEIKARHILSEVGGLLSVVIDPSLTGASTEPALDLTATHTIVTSPIVEPALDLAVSSPMPR